MGDGYEGECGWVCESGPVGDDVPGDLDNGDAYRCELGLVENGKGAGEVEGLDCAEGGDDAGRVSEAFVVIVLALLDVAVALLVETCAVATSDPGDTTAS